MYKRKKKYKLNTSNREHRKMMLRNLFTSLVLTREIETTNRRAKTLKDYAQKMFSAFLKMQDSLQKERWVKANILTRRFYHRAYKTLQQLHSVGYKIRIHATRFRNGDGSIMYKVVLEIPSKDKESNSKGKSKDSIKTVEVVKHIKDGKSKKIKERQKNENTSKLTGDNSSE